MPPKAAIEGNVHHYAEIVGGRMPLTAPEVALVRRPDRLGRLQRLWNSAQFFSLTQSASRPETAEVRSAGRTRQCEK